MSTSDQQTAALRRALTGIDELQRRLELYRQAEREPIAIVGIGCRFPGGVDSPGAYWMLLQNGMDAVTEVPAERWKVEEFYDQDPQAPGKTYTRSGGFLSEVDKFDASFFGIAPREANRMDPQQRLLLEVTWEALENAGIPPNTLAKSATGVFVGASISDYGILQYSAPDIVDTYSTTGTALAVIANRISYQFDLRGPSMTIDTACSSSLVALHEACRSLRSRECNCSIAGGVNIMLVPGVAVSLAKLGALSPDGRCRTFDARANGFVRGEGCGVVVLKRLSDAIASGDRIVALIRGSAVHSEGRSNGLTAPSAPAQEAMIRRALAESGLDPSQISYIEAHGTGTVLGDPIEVEALAPVYGPPRQDGLPCLLGSVKTNIGHLEAAAGIAGVIKTVLCLQHRAVVPNVHFQSLNPYISLQGTRLTVATAHKPWPPEEIPFFAAVSSFGVGGTIAHAILEEPPRHVTSAPAAIVDWIQPARQQAHLLALSAHNEAALRALAESFKSELMHGQLAAETVADICFSASVRRAHHAHRLAVVGDTTRALTEALDASIREETRPGVSHGQCQPDEVRQPVFVFNGHGSQWIAMARPLMENERPFREAIERCHEAMQRETGWQLCAELNADEAVSRLEDVDVVQRVIFAMHVALAAQWRAFGVDPSVVVGHSLGEIAAAHVAGILSLDDAVRVICARSRLVRQHAEVPGGLLAVETTLEEAEALTAPFGNRLVVGVVNSPTFIALSGDDQTLSEMQDRLLSRRIFCKRVHIRFASHSPMMTNAADAIRQELRGIQPQPAHIPFFSTVTNRFEQGEKLDADYWARNLTDRVQFASAIQTLGQNGYNCFLEIGGHPVLLHAIGDNLTHVGIEGIAVASLVRGRGDRPRLLEGLGELYCAGCPIEFQRLYSKNSHSFTPLPTYPFQRKRYWLPKVVSANVRSVGGYEQSAHPVFRSGVHVMSSTHEGDHLWQFDLDTELLPYLRDHLVKKMAIVPAALHLELAASAGREILGDGVVHIQDAMFVEGLVLPEKVERRVQVMLSGDPSTGAEFGISTQNTEDRKWTIHAKGQIRIREPGFEIDALPNEPISVIQRRCGEQVSKEEHYRRADLRGIHYGPTFRGIEVAWYGHGEVLTRVQWPEILMGDAAGYTFHPAVLDACLQAMIGVVHSTEDPDVSGLWMPVAMRSFLLKTTPRPGQLLWVHACRTEGENTASRNAFADVRIFDSDETLLAEARGICAHRFGSPAEEQPTGWTYAFTWREQPAASSEKDTAGTWLIFTDKGGVGRAVEEALGHGGGRCILVRGGNDLRNVESDLFTLDPASPRHFVELFDLLHGSKCLPLRGIIYLWALNNNHADATTLKPFDRVAGASCIPALYLVQALAARLEGSPPRLWLVTRGAQHACPGDGVPAVGHSALWGLGRTISGEHPALQCTCVDLEPGDARNAARALLRALKHDESEHEFALRGDRQLVSRLIRRSMTTKPPDAPRVAMAPGRDMFRIELHQAGVIDDLALAPARRPEPGPDQVQIAVYAAGLNFRDVLKVLGQYPVPSDGEVPLGDECAGVITSVGRQVDGFKVGDEVIAVLPGRSFASFVVADTCQLARKPTRLSFEEAATIPAAYLTAWFALQHIARLRPGERVLIHAATGGVGLAAVQISRYLGAEIYATAGSPEKRAYLHSLGVMHTFDSRSLAFVDGVRQATAGQGVDVVLNSLAGDFIPASLSLLRSFGRFIEIGKKDIYGNYRLMLSPFQRGLSFSTVDLELVFLERPSLFAEMMREITDALEAGRFPPICRHVFPISRAAEAFRFMAQAKHMGKIALSFHEAEVELYSAHGVVFRPDASYLITGGLGALGLAVARWMAERGARHLILMGRSEPAEKAKETIAALEGEGVHVRVVRGDVSLLDDLRRVFVEIEASMPILRGVLHAAGVLEDSTLLNMDRARFHTVLAPKVAGAWNLHRLTLDRCLDHFILFSSVAGVLGAPGQGNYAAANAFLDSLAWHRKALGLPAVSIDWGAWGDIGMAVIQATRGRNVAASGLGPLSPTEALATLGQVLQQNHPQVIVMRFNAQRWRASASGRSALLTELVNYEINEDAFDTKPIRVQLLESEPVSRASLLTSYLTTQLAKILQFSSEQIREDMPFRQMGMDSLTSLELKNRLEAALGVRFPVSAIWNYPTISKLVTHLVRMLEVSLGEAKDVRESVRPRPHDVDLEGVLRDLSDEELAALAAEDLD